MIKRSQIPTIVSGKRRAPNFTKFG